MISRSEQLSKLNDQMSGSLENVNELPAQNTADKDFLKGIRTSSARQKTASQQLISSFIRVREKLVANNAVVVVQFRKYRDGRSTKLGRLLASLPDVRLRANQEERE